MAVKRLLTAVLVVVLAMPVRAADLRLALPPELLEAGLGTHLLPRFRFKTRIRLEAVPAGTPADMALRAGPGTGSLPVFRSGEDTAYQLHVLDDGPPVADAAERFVAWLRSEPGRAAIESFEVEGERPLRAGAPPETRAAAPVVEGDAARGSRLALVHCGRCHVIDARNPFGGIGSTPSFRAMRGQPDWQPRFEAFWTFSPHPAFTQIEGITPPFPPERPSPIAPLRLTQEDAQAIAAFVATLEPKDLGAQVEAR